VSQNGRGFVTPQERCHASRVNGVVFAPLTNDIKLRLRGIPAHAVDSPPRRNDREHSHDVIGRGDHNHTVKTPAEHCNLMGQPVEPISLALDLVA